MKKPERILIFELNWMGDILFSFPFIRALRKSLPEAYITCVVPPRYFSLLIHNPWVNYVHVLRDTNSFLSIGEKIAFVNMIKKEKYDTCFLLKPSKTKALMASMAGIPERIGFSGKKYSITREIDSPINDVHRADHVLALAAVLGSEKIDGTYEYFFSREDEERADAVLHKERAGARRMVAINPGGNWEAKRWPSERFVELARRLLDEFENIEIMITGAEKDLNLIKKMMGKIDSKRCYTTAGKTGLNELAALFKQCDLVISADSGPLHLASANGVTTIGLFGPTAKHITGPRGRGQNIVISKGVDCQVPCYEKECGRDYECMKGITVDEVFLTAKKILSADA